MEPEGKIPEQGAPAEADRAGRRRQGSDLAWLAIATVFGAGRLPMAPGTWGSALTVGLYVLALRGASTATLGVVLAGVTILGVLSANVAERVLGKKDPGEVVIDEVAGQLVAVLPIHHSGLATPGPILLSFLAFRAFDVLKPFPCYQLQRLPGGLGVMADDLFAGLYACLVAYGAALILR
jgi:phosphatidylglycerophosphatase A